MSCCLLNAWAHATCSAHSLCAKLTSAFEAHSTPTPLICPPRAHTPSPAHTARTAPPRPPARPAPSPRAPPLPTHTARAPPPNPPRALRPAQPPRTCTRPPPAQTWRSRCRTCRAAPSRPSPRGSARAWWAPAWRRGGGAQTPVGQHAGCGRWAGACCAAPRRCATSSSGCRRCRQAGQAGWGPASIHGASDGRPWSAQEGMRRQLGCARVHTVSLSMGTAFLSKLGTA